MLKNFRKTLVFVVCACMLLSGIAYLAPQSDHNRTLVNNSISFSYGTVTRFYIINNMSIPTPQNFVEHIIINSSRYANENPNLSNIFFMMSDITLIPSWLQSGNSNSAFNTSYWLRINQSIPAYSYLPICMDYATPGNNILNNYSIGEAPQLTNVYGLYDDGSHIFNFYDNFAGTKLNTTEWKPSSSNIKVDDGITFSSSNSYITSRTQYAFDSCVEAYGIMNSPSTNSSTSYDLGGVGFGENGMDYTSPVITSGWAENHTNGLGLTVYNGNGPFQYSYSKSINDTTYNTFGTGLIRNNYTRGTVNTIYENSSTENLGLSGNGNLNITLGFQSNDFPTVNNFRYIMEFNTTPHGVGVPYSFELHNVKFKEEGLPVGDFWSLTILNLFNALGNGGDTVQLCENFSLPNGIYNYSVYSEQGGYQATSNSGTFKVENNNVVVNVSFVHAKTDTSFVEKNLPKGTQWILNIYNNSTNFTTYKTNQTSIVIPLENGTYKVFLNESANGYIPIPDYKRIIVDGFARTYNIEYESPANRSLLNPLKSFNPSQHQVNSGYNNILSGGVSISSLVVDSAANVIYSIIQSSGVIVPYNITTGNYMKNITIGAKSNPACAFYNPQNGYIYVSDMGTGNLTIINGRTDAIIENITLPFLKNSDFSIVQSSTSNVLYVFGFNYTNTSNGTSYVISSSGNILAHHNFTGLSPQNYIGSFPILASPAMYGQNLILANGTGIDVLNLSDGHKAFYAAPEYYCPDLLVPYGHTGKFIVSNEVNNTSLIFNAVTSQMCDGPLIPGEVLGGLFDPINNYLYVSSRSTSCICTANITIISPQEGKVITSIPISEPEDNVVFSSVNQSIFGLNYNENCVIYHSFEVTKGYTVSFEENGLPSNETWFLNISGMNSSGPIKAGTIYSVNLTVGNYYYTAMTNDKKFSGNSGNIEVDSSETVNVKFSSVNFKVNFIETGLTGISWAVTVNGTLYKISGSEISINLSNGTYDYNVNSINGYSIRNKEGNFTVYGKMTTIYVAFSRLVYKITFDELGLPDGTTWEITLNGVQHNVTGNTFSIYVPNGTYQYSIGSVNGYSATNQTGNITLSGAGASVNITFSKISSTSTAFYIEAGVVVAVVVAVVGLLVWRRISK